MSFPFKNYSHVEVIHSPFFWKKFERPPPPPPIFTKIAKTQPPFLLKGGGVTSMTMLRKH